MPYAAFAIALQTRMVARTEAVEEVLGRLVLQSAVIHKRGDGDIAVAHAALQGLFHSLGVVLLTIAYVVSDEPETFLRAVAVVDELLGGYSVCFLGHCT